MLYGGLSRYGRRMLSSFSFMSPQNLICEPGSSAKVGPIVKSMGCKNLAVLTDSGITTLGLLDASLDSCKKAGVEVSVWDETVPDPPAEKVLDAVAAVKDSNADAIMGFGGGSSMDIAKLVALLGHPNCTQSLEDLYGLDKCIGPRLPMVLVPTTAGTGSEVTHLSIITTGEKTKMGVGSQWLLSDYAILDADLTLGLPPFVTAATGIDAMVHAIEAYTSKFKKNDYSDMLARQALLLLSSNIRKVCFKEGMRNREARAKMLLGSCYAGMAFTNAPVAAVHALAYPLGTHFHLSHGHSNSLVLPSVLEFNLPNAEKEYAQLASFVLTREESEGLNESEMASAFVEYYRDLNKDLLPGRNSLSECGVGREDIAVLAKEAMKQTRLLPNNPREVRLEDAEHIYTKAYANIM